MVRCIGMQLRSISNQSICCDMGIDTTEMRLKLEHLKKRRDELSDQILASTSNHQRFLQLLSEQRQVMLDIQTINIKLENIRLRKPINGTNENSNIGYI
jgi:hypothetical protein